MSRGMAAGEGVVSQAATDQYRSEHERIFGERKPARGRWVQDPVTGDLVDAASYVPPSEAKDAPVAVGRFYEGIALPDGTVCQTRRQYSEYMRRNGVTAASDFSPEYRQQTQRTAELRDAREAERTVSDAIGRAVDLSQKSYDAEVRASERRRAERARIWREHGEGK